MEHLIRVGEDTWLLGMVFLSWQNSREYGISAAPSLFYEDFQNNPSFFHYREFLPAQLSIIEGITQGDKHFIASHLHGKLDDSLHGWELFYLNLKINLCYIFVSPLLYFHLSELFLKDMCIVPDLSSFAP